jgi:Glutathione S-transferase, N-terminal domain
VIAPRVTMAAMAKPPSITLLRSVLASTVRGWRGTQVMRQAKAPAQLLVVFDRENDPQCRLLRELLTELQLDALIRPCPFGGKRFASKLPKRAELPVLVDADAGVEVVGLHACLAHVLHHYADLERGSGLLGSVPMQITSKLASVLRGEAGLQAQPSRAPRKPLELYSFESSPYSRLVRERLSELELPWILRNFGKEQLADWGPPTRRFTLRKWTAKPGGRREKMLEDTGKAQVPYLIDPNTKTELFESTKILKYLDLQYAR